MGRIGAFLFGFVVGCAALYFSEHFHLIHAHDGWHTIRKTTPRFSEVYVDIRKYGPNEWLEHPGLYTALAKAEKTELIPQSMGNTALQPFRDKIDNVMNSIELPTSP